MPALASVHASTGVTSASRISARRQEFGRQAGLRPETQSAELRSELALGARQAFQALDRAFRPRSWRAPDVHVTARVTYQGLKRGNTFLGTSSKMFLRSCALSEPIPS